MIERIQIVVNDDGTVTVVKNFDRLSQASAKAATGVDQLKNSINRTSAGLQKANVGNIAAQFQDIGVTAAMMQNPLQIALQQGTQLAAVFSQSGGGLGAALKQVGLAFMQVLSPLSLFTIGAVAAVAAIVQNIDWMKVLNQTIIIVSGYLQSLISTLQQYPGVLAAVGAALLVAFGPASLTAVYSLTTAIGVGLFSAVSSVFTLILANPITAAIMAIAAGIAYAITVTIGWQPVIAAIIKSFGYLVELVGKFSDAMGWTEGLARYGFEVRINADKAAADMVNAGAQMANDLKGSLKQASGWARDNIDAGGRIAAKDMKDGIVAGGKEAANALKNAQDAGIARYEELNGKVIKPLGDTLTDGGKYIYNQVTGATTKAGDTMNKGIQTGGKTAGETMQKAIVSGGQQAASAINGEIGGLIQAAFRYSSQIDAVDQIINAQLRIMRAEALKINSEAIKTRREAMGNSGNSNNNNSSGSYGNTSGRKTYTSVVTNTRAPINSFPTTPKETTTTKDGEQSIELNVTNITDPSAAVLAINTAQGAKNVLNVVKLNKAEFQEALGII